MGSGLPVVSGREAAGAFARIGFVERPSRGRGSHIVMFRPESPRILTIPDHREVKRGTLRAVIRDAGMTVEQFVSLLD